MGIFKDALKGAMKEAIVGATVGTGLSVIGGALSIIEENTNKSQLSKMAKENEYCLFVDCDREIGFTSFLLYNAFLHSVSMFFVIVYCILALAFGLHNLIIDIIMVVISLLNIYCIILQRTNYLKIKEYCCKYYNRLYKKLACFDNEIMRQIYANEPSLLLSDYKVICNLKEAFEGKKDCYIRNADIDNLKRIPKCVEPLLQRKNSGRTNAVSDGRLLELCSSIKGPYTLLQRRADHLQRRFRVSGRKLLDRTAIITEDAECELLYKKIVPEDAVSNYCLAFVLLYEQFTNEVRKVKVNEV